MTQEVKRMDINIDRPILNKDTVEENMAVVDSWIADTADKLNYLIEQLNKERNNNG